MMVQQFIKLCLHDSNLAETLDNRVAFQQKGSPTFFKFTQFQNKLYVDSSLEIHHVSEGLTFAAPFFVVTWKMHWMARINTW